jgi:tight adherence protein C
LTESAAWAVLCGIGLGFGLWSLASLVPRLSRPRLIDRVAPYLVDVSSGARELVGRRSLEPLPVFGTLLAPVFGRARELLGSLLGGSAGITLRLRQSGSTLGVDAYRSRQLVWSMCGAGAGVIVAVVAARTWPIPFIVEVVIVVISAMGGLMARDYLLQRAARARLASMTSELPTVLEFLTLSLSAGEGIFDAIRRVGRASHGELAREFAGVVSAVNTGIPFVDALGRLSDGIRLAPLSRVIDQITGALDRGTPLAEVLRAQAQDARDEAKRDLLERAGKKEVAMLLPLVFFILPVTVIFAIFPGVVVLQMGL